MADLLGNDPAAEFLQQEEDQLRELGIDENQFTDDPSSDNAGGIDLMNEFQGEIDTAMPAESMINGFQDSTPVQQISTMPAEEPASLIKWREEKTLALQKQEEDEAEARVLWQEKAKKELEDWYNRYNEQLEKVKNENRSAQEQFIEEMTDTKPGNEWKKTARFCDFNPKFSKNTKDVSRMRSLLLQLKQNPLVR